LAQRAAEILKPYDKTVVEAAEFYAKHLRTITASLKVSDVVKELHAARKVDGASTDYLNDLRLRLGAFSRAFDGRVSCPSLRRARLTGRGTAKDRDFVFFITSTTIYLMEPNVYHTGR
jgi:hypothetical protein